MPTTAFGADLSSPSRACAVLRARANAAGVPLGAADVPDLAAAVLGAHTWLVTLRRSTLSGPHARPEAAALAAVYARASGHGSTAALEDDLADAGLPDATLAEIVPVAQWAWDQAGEAALERAAADLASSTSPALRSAAAVLASLADDLVNQPAPRTASN